MDAITSHVLAFNGGAVVGIVLLWAALARKLRK